MRPVLDESLHTFRRFAERHGYDVVVGGEEAIEDRAPAWSKVVLLRRLLEHHDYVLWIDPDAIILDDSVDPVSLFAEGHYQALVRHRWNEEECVCTGARILRNVEEAVAFPDAVWNGGDVYLRLHPWEQAAAMRLLGYSVDPDRVVADTEGTAGTCGSTTSGTPFRLHTRPSLGAMQDPSPRARIEPGSLATDAHGSSRC